MLVTNDRWTDGRVEFFSPEDREYITASYNYSIDIMDGHLEVWHPDGMWQFLPRWWSLN